MVNDIGISPGSPYTERLGHDLDTPKIHFKNFLWVISILDAPFSEKRKSMSTFCRVLSFKVDQFSTLYKRIGATYEWKSLMDVLTGILNRAMAHNKGLKAFLPLSLSTFIACFIVPLHLISKT